MSQPDVGQAYREEGSLAMQRQGNEHAEEKDTDIERVDTPPIDVSSRQAREYSGWALCKICFAALGICYSDIGTSPLYVLNGILPSTGSPPSKEDAIGIISIIFWLFTIVVIVKYGCFILGFGTLAGEGGSFALYQGLFPRPAHDDWDENGMGSISRALSFYPAQSITADVAASPASNRRDIRERLLASNWLKPLLAAWALWGSGLTMADGIITPAISVVSAAEGIAIVESGAPIVGISLAILIVVALAQPLGAHRLSYLFSPIVTLWLVFLFVTGAINIASFPGIFRAIDPSRAILYFVRTGNYDAIAGALLAVTGCEALFANLGQFSRMSITWPLLVFVYPSLMLAYLGQGSKLVSNPDCVSNIFYLSIPGGAGSPAYYLGLVLGILATIIASQATFTAVFSIVSQLVHMQCLPSIKQSFPSETNPGQVYQHATNILLSAAIIGVVAGFQGSSNLTAAYGFAVATVMLTTTVLVALQIYFVRRRPWFLALLFFLLFGFVDGLTWGASVRKVPEGAWFSLGVGSALAVFMVWWSWCSDIIHAFDRANRRPLSSVVEYFEEDDLKSKPEQTVLRLRTLDGHRPKVTRMEQTMSVFWKPAGGRGVPHAFCAFVSKLPAISTFTVFLSLRVLPVAHVVPSQQLLVERHRSRSGFYGATLRVGYKDKLDMRGTEGRLLDAIVSLESSAVNTVNSEGPGNAQSQVEQKIRSSDLIYTHIWPSYYLTTKPSALAITSISDRKDLARLMRPGVLGHTVLHLLRTFLLCALFRRVRGAFAEEEGPFESSEEVVRVLIFAEV